VADAGIRRSGTVRSPSAASSRKQDGRPLGFERARGDDELWSATTMPRDVRHDPQRDGPGGQLRTRQTPLPGGTAANGRAATLPAPVPTGWRRHLPAVLALLVLLLTLLRLEHAAWVNTMTADEMFHIPQGLALVADGDARAQPENGILIQRLIGWSARLGASPDVTARLPATPVTIAERFAFFRAAIYDSGVEPQRLVWAARQAVIALGLGLCLLVFAWARRCWGAWGGLVSLLMVAFSPDFLAHAALATSDVAFWFLSLLTVFVGWRLLQRPQPWTTALTGVLLGAALATKFNGLLLVPILGILWLAMALPRRAAAAEGLDAVVAGQPLRSLLALALAGVVAWITLWACYGFERYAGPDTGRLDWAQVSQAGVSPAMLWWRGTGLLPDTFLFGLQYVLQAASARVSYLAGEIAVHGRLAFFPLALGWKTPIATLVLLALGLGFGVASLWRGEGRRRWRDWLPLVVVAVVFGASALAANLNIGVRHVMPAVVPVFILAGGIVQALPRRRTWLLPLLLGVLALESLSIHPHHLAFFNAAAGGPSRGYRLLVDSNLDWGQGLDALARYSRRVPAGTRLHYAYFGTALPSRHGVRGAVLRTYGAFENPRHVLAPGPGLYAISATVLPNLFETRELRGPWRTDLEPAYQGLRARAQANEPLSAAEIDLLNRLIMSRLLQILRAREPDELIDYSILVYRLEADDLARLADGPLPP
jgi:4-amino-4-deoxy-L-arabinose transferase-like glycosyltransferase